MTSSPNNLLWKADTAPIPLQVVVIDDGTGESVQPYLHFFFDDEEIPPEIQATASLSVTLGPDRRSVTHVEQIHGGVVGGRSSADPLAYDVNADDDGLILRVRGTFPEAKFSAALAAGAGALMTLLDEYFSNLEQARSLLLSRDTQSLMDELKEHAEGRSRTESMSVDAAVQVSDEEEEKETPGVMLRSSVASMRQPPRPAPIEVPPRPVHPPTPKSAVMSPFRRTSHAPRAPWSPTTAELSRSLSETALAKTADKSPPASVLFPDRSGLGTRVQGSSLPSVGQVAKPPRPPAISLDGDYDNVVARLRRGFQVLRSGRDNRNQPVAALRLDKE